MYHFNTVSALEMDEVQEIQHQQELMELNEFVERVRNYDCAVLAKYQDPLNSKKKQQILSCKLYDFASMIDHFDSKNGVDAFYSDDAFLTLLVYGSLYELAGEYHYTTVALKFMPYDENEEFVDIWDLMIDWD